MYDRNAFIMSEAPLKKSLYKLFNKKDKITIFDVGGCEGEDSIRYSRIFPNARIFVFEPLPNNQKLILQNLEKYQGLNIELIPMALSDESGQMDFYVSSGHPGDQDAKLDWDFGNKSSSLLPPGEHLNRVPWIQFKEVVSVDTIKVKDFLKQRSIAEIDFMHMDVQGAELKVLSGAEEMLSCVKAIWLEVANIKLYQDQPLRPEVEAYMQGRGFYLIKSSISDQSEYGDQMYLNHKYFKSFTAFNNFFQMHFPKK